MSDTSFTLHKIKDLISEHMSGPSPTCEERQIASAEEWGLLKTTAVTWNGWDQTAHKVPPEEYWRNHRIEVKAGDVLVTKAGPRHRVGVVVYVDKTPPRLMVSGKMIGLRPDPEKVNYKVLAAALSQYEPQRFLDSRTTGMADSQLNFTNELLLNTEVLLPPKPEQTKIAEILSTVDRATEQTEALIAKQQRIKTGLMHDLLTRGIDEHGNLRSEETHEFKDSPLGRIPVEWEVVKLSNYIAFIRSGLSRRILEDDIGVPVITSTNIQQSRLDTTQLSYWYLKDPQGAKTESFFLNDGDILLNFINSVEQIGKVCLFQNLGRPTIYTTNLFRIKANQITSQDFLFHLLDSQVVQNEIKQITKPAVNQASFTTGDFLGISVPLILYDEQLRIVEFLFALNNHNNGAILSLSKLKHEKTALVQDLLTGKKRVSALLNSTEVVHG